MAVSLGHAVFAALSADPARPLVAGDAPLSAADLLASAAGFAAALRAHDCRAESRIVLCLQSSSDMLIGMLGCWAIGATPLMMDFRTPASQRAAVAAALGAALTVESRRPPGAADYAGAVMDEGWRRRDRGQATFAELPDPGRAPAFFTLSSGTTGAPKIYIQSHELLLRRLTGVSGKFAGGQGLFLTPMNLSVAATRNRVLNYMLGGGRLHFMAPLFSTSEIIEALASTRATGSALPPPVIARMVAEIGTRSSPCFPHLELLRSTGGPALPQDKIAAYRYLTPGYRMAYSSNLTGPATVLAGPDILERPDSTGRALPHVRLEIIGDEGQVLPIGETGLIRVHTPFLSDGVIEGGSGASRGREERGPGWGMAGDIGWIDARGFLTIVGRAADMIVRGGVNVAPQEIEAILRGHAGVTDVAVTGIDDARYGQEIGAAIVASEGTEADFHAYCMRHIAPDRRPRIICVVAALPYTINGKLQRAKVAQMLSEQP